jgi:hypothetical protein
MTGARGQLGRDNLAERPPRPQDRLYDAMSRQVAAAGLRVGPCPEAVVTDADLAGLPDAVQPYLRFMGVVGRPRDRSFRARFVGRFRLRPGADLAKRSRPRTRPAAPICTR